MHRCFVVFLCQYIHSFKFPGTAERGGYSPHSHPSKSATEKCQYLSNTNTLLHSIAYKNTYLACRQLQDHHYSVASFQMISTSFNQLTTSTTILKNNYETHRLVPGIYGLTDINLLLPKRHQY